MYKFKSIQTICIVFCIVYNIFTFIFQLTYLCLFYIIINGLIPLCLNVCISASTLFCWIHGKRNSQNTKRWQCIPFILRSNEITDLFLCYSPTSHSAMKCNYPQPFRRSSSDFANSISRSSLLYIRNPSCTFGSHWSVFT